MGKPEGKRQFGSPRRKQHENIMMDLREVGWSGMDCIDVALYRDHWTLVNMVMNLRIP
jgi:hypothetical protein